MTTTIGTILSATLVSCPTLTTTPSCPEVMNPCARTSTSYLPGARSIVTAPCSRALVFCH